MAMGQEPTQSGGVPSLVELELAGATIGEIRIDNQNIFDLSDRKENNALFSLANRLHIRTRPEVIRNQLLFKSGELLSVRVIEETERLLRANSYLYDVKILPYAWHDGVVDIKVSTRDTWTFSPSGSLSRQGGVNKAGLGFKEANLLGTGMRFSIATRGTVGGDGPAKNGAELQLNYPNVLGSRATINYTKATFGDNSSQSLSAIRPFYALDTRWAAGASAGNSDSVISSYANGNLTSQYRRNQDRAEAWGGWSEGLVDGWAHRYSGGVAYDNAAYSAGPALAPPAQLAPDRTLVGPFLRYEGIQDDFRKLTNRDQIGRPEYFSLGWRSTLQFGRVLVGLGSTQNASLYSGSLSKGLGVSADSTLLVATALSGEYANGRGDRQLLSGSARYYLRQDSGSVFFASVAGDRAKYSDGTQLFAIGGDTGLRGYPASYQTGDRRVIFTSEQRFYTDWYPFQLFRVGGAVFYDMGRVWSGPYQNAASDRWLHNAGFGARILSARSSTGTTLHFDFAFPLKRDPGTRSFLFSFHSKTGF
jgi:hemolysin activation/secretion protein